MFTFKSKSVRVIHNNLSTGDLSVGVPVWSSSQQGSLLGTESTFCSRELEKGVQVGLLSHIKLMLLTTCIDHLYLVLDSSFAPSLKVLCYKGDKARRAEIQREINTNEFHVLITTYEVGLCND